MSLSRSVRRPAAALAGAAGLLAVAAAPALAASVGTVGGSAFGISSTLSVLHVATVTIPAQPTATLPPTGSTGITNSTVNLNVGALGASVKAALLTAHTDGKIDPNGVANSSAEVHGLNAVLSTLPVLKYSVVKSECTASASQLSGTTTLLVANPLGGGDIPIAVPTVPINIPGVGKITFNEQVVSPDGRSIVVNAIHVTGSPGIGGASILSGDLIISQSTCSTTDASAPVVSESSHAALMLGAVALLGAGGVFVIRRRNIGGSAA